MDELSRNESIQTVDRTSRSPTPSVPRRRLRCFAYAAVLLVCGYLNYACTYLSTTFYPQEAKARKGSRADTLVGVMIGGNQLSAVIAALVVGAHMNRLGVKFILLAAPFLVGGCTVIFGFLEDVDSWTPFICLSIAIYFVMGFGQTAFTTAANTVVVTMFPSHVAVVWAVVEFALGLGFITSAPLGGWLYDTKGFFFPFVVIGGALLLFIPLLLVFRSDTHFISRQVVTGNRMSMWALLKMIPVLVVCVNQLLSLAPLASFQTSLALYLGNTYGWRATQIGLLFLILGGTYVGSSIAVGALIDATNPRVMMIIGLLMEGCGLLYIAPSFLFTSLSPEPWLVYMAMALIGFGLSLITTSAPPDIIATAVSRGYKKDMSLNGVVAGVIGAATFLSGALFSPIAGALTASYGFRHTTTYFAFGIFLQFVVTIIISVIEKGTFLKIYRQPVTNEI
ncbi:MFS-type transporter SLC18B1-like [Corticium candelabrum]|uniref:MFS-type transporter SLC18B1-like n=1 Tax=Corticium candelabrum TaxID=121492 RepID=UPI002E26656F|nr:MFS-type transporter SLC18B1-like [Corticium candelabrum]